MIDKKLLIVGLDPGTTIGYAVLGIDGDLIHAASSKQFNLNTLISETVRFGKAVLVGTDKCKVPRLVEEFAAKTGARTVSPEEDIRVDEKRKITNGFDLKDEHQSDALASALFAYKSAKPLLDKIDFFAEENNKQSIKDKIKELVIAKQISIKRSASIIERKEDEDKIMGKVVMEKKLDEKDFMRLYNKLKNYESQMKYLKSYSNNLRNRVLSLEKYLLESKAPKPDNRISDFREKRIMSLENALKTKQKNLVYLRNLLDRFNSILSNINDYYIIKKLDNLGIKEFNSKNKIVNIKKNDMILVDDPNIFSEEVVRILKSKVFVAVHRKPVSKKIEKELPFILINSKNLSIDEDKYFCFVNKKQFESEKNKIDWIKRIVEDYKNERLVIR